MCVWSPLAHRCGNTDSFAKGNWLGAIRAALISVRNRTFRMELRHHHQGFGYPCLSNPYQRACHFAQPQPWLVSPSFLGWQFSFVGSAVWILAFLPYCGPRNKRIGRYRRTCAAAPELLASLCHRWFSLSSGWKFRGDLTLLAPDADCTHRE